MFPHERHGKPRSSSPPGLTLAQKQKYIEQYNFENCAEISKYDQGVKIGQGTFG